MISYIKVLVIAMLPVIEIRGAIPYAQAINLPIIPSFIVAVVGNILPIPFIYLFARKVLEYLSEKKHIDKIFKWILNRGHRACVKLNEKNKNSLFIALMLFVAIPIPGTGAWTGVLGASILGMGLKKTSIASSIGVIIAGLIMFIISFGIKGIIKY